MSQVNVNRSPGAEAPTREAPGEANAQRSRARAAGAQGRGS